MDSIIIDTPWGKMDVNFTGDRVVFTGTDLSLVYNKVRYPRLSVTFRPDQENLRPMYVIDKPLLSPGGVDRWIVLYGDFKPSRAGWNNKATPSGSKKCAAEVLPWLGSWLTTNEIAQAYHSEALAESRMICQKQLAVWIADLERRLNDTRELLQRSFEGDEIQEGEMKRVLTYLFPPSKSRVA